MPNVEALFAEALRRHHARQFAEAEHLCRQVLAVAPRHADSLNLLGVIAHQVGRTDVAVELISKAIGCNGATAAYRSNLGIMLKGLGRVEAAVAAHKTAIRIEPDYAEAYSNLGNALKGLGQVSDAVAAYQAAIRIKPDYAEAHSNLGNALRELGRIGHAADACSAAVRAKPDFAEAYSNLGNALKALGRLDEAVAAYNSAIRIKPELAEAHSNLGVALYDLGHLDEAAAAYRAALRIRPDYAEAYYNLGNALYDWARLIDAVAAHTTALRLKPDYAEAYCNRGNALKDLGRLDEAVASYTAAIGIKPDYADAHSNLLLCVHYLPGFRGRNILEIARRFADQVGTKFVPVLRCSPDPDRRLRIGYVSGDFGRHPVGYFLSRVLANHDRVAVEIFCYSTSARADDMTTQLQSMADHWRSLVGWSDQAAADLVAGDGIDILVDLSGHTALNRLPMFARKPAPIQVSWLGYFGTTGLTAMDYVLADRFVAPEDAARDFTESIWHLPDSYLCFCPPDFECVVLPPPMTKGEPIVFGSFNNHAKLSSPTVALWSRILKRVAGSRLLLKTKALANAKECQQLLDQFARNGIEKERLCLEGASPRAELLSTYNRVDVALDPTPYGGGTTTAEALWMGVPVVTLRGATWVGRVGESILSTVGLSELVATSPDHYVEIAVGLASDESRLKALRSRLRHQLEASAFCDGTRFTRNLEQAYRSMWRKWCANHADRGRP